MSGEGSYYNLLVRNLDSGQNRYGLIVRRSNTTKDRKGQHTNNKISSALKFLAIYQMSQQQYTEGETKTKNVKIKFMQVFLSYKQLSILLLCRIYFLRDYVNSYLKIISITRAISNVTFK